MESKEHRHEFVTIDFYGKESYLNEDLFAFVDLFPRYLYTGIEEYWDRNIDSGTVHKQLSMIKYCKEVSKDNEESRSLLEERKNQLGSIIEETKYFLFDAGKFFIDTWKIDHPSALLKNPKIHFFNNVKENNNFNESEYYTTRPFLQEKTIMLTNGANTFLSEGGSGTNGGLTSLSSNFFSTCTKLYEPNDTLLSILNQIPMNGNQKITPSCVESGIRVSFPAGTVFKNTFNLNLERKFLNVTTTINGVYHIKGINWAKVSPEQKQRERSYSNYLFVEAYYSKILNDFNQTDTYALYLAQVPGEIFKGEQGTKNGLVNAVSSFLSTMNKEKHVIVGIENPVEKPKLQPMYMLWYNLLTYNSKGF